MDLMTELCNSAKLNISSDANKLKARVIVYDEKTKRILICNYGGVYLLPGGGLEEGETPIDTIKRELEEEVGLCFYKNSLQHAGIDVYEIPKYPGRDGNKKDARIITFYFQTYLSDVKRITTKNLTEGEKKDNFIILWVDIYEAVNKIKNNNTDNPREKYFSKMAINVLRPFINVLDLHKKKETITIDEKELSENTKYLEEFKKFDPLFPDKENHFKNGSFYRVLIIDEKPISIMFLRKVEKEGYSLDYIYTKERYRNCLYATELIESTLYMLEKKHNGVPPLTTSEECSFLKEHLNEKGAEITRMNPRLLIKK